MSKARTIGDLKREAEEMIAKGEMPSRKEYLRMVAEIKRDYIARVRFERLKTAKVVQ